MATPTGGVGGDAPPGAIDPLYSYTHGSGANQGRSVTGGYVYRGPIAELAGHYFFADYINHRVWSFRQVNGQVEDFTDWTPVLRKGNFPFRFIASLSEDNAGNLYFMSIVDGHIFMLTGGTFADDIPPNIALKGKKSRRVNKKRPVFRGTAWDDNQVVAVYYSYRGRIRQANGTTIWKFRPVAQRRPANRIKIWAVDQQGLTSKVIKARVRRR